MMETYERIYVSLSADQLGNVQLRLATSPPQGSPCAVLLSRGGIMQGDEMIVSLNAAAVTLTIS